MSQFDPFVHLHNHTDYSIYDGFQTPESLAKRASELNQKAVAITDHGKIGGFIKFYKACKKYNIKPLLGVELYICHDLSIKKNSGGGKRYHLLVLAKNNIGLSNIYKLCSESHRHTAYNFPRVNFDMLKEHSEGLIISTACMGGEFAKMVSEGHKDEAFTIAKKYKDHWGDDFYLEVMYTDKKDSELGMKQIDVIKAAIECSKKYNIKIIATNDCHYSCKGFYRHQQVKKAISSRKPLREPDAPEYYLKSYNQMKKLFKGIGKEWLHNTVEVADKCNVEITFGKASLPEFVIPEDEDFKKYKKNRFGQNDEQSYLRYLSLKGLQEKGLYDGGKYLQRLEDELETIKFTGFDRYFLIVQGYTSYAREKNIRIGKGRGSGVGSLVLYCLGVTDIDPIKYGLTMDRFLYCEAEYHTDLSDIFSDKKQEIKEPQGRGNRKRKKTDKELILFKKMKEYISKKIKSSSIEFTEDKKDRIREELKFFLKHPTLVEDICDLIKYVKNKNITGDCNSTNSLCFEVLGLTNKKCDCSKNYHFRYIVDKKQSRVSPPDIDIDFEERETILTHLCNIYGQDKVALIGTVNTYKPKAAIQNAAKALDITGTNNRYRKPDGNFERFSPENDQKAKEISKLMPNIPGIDLSQFVGEDESFKPPNKRVGECIEKMKAVKEEYPDLIEVAKGLEGKIRAYGTHAAGVVISSHPITDDVPLHYAKVQRESFSDEIIASENIELLTTQYDMEEVEELGLLKFDFLQLQNLRQISECMNLIHERYGDVSFDIDNLETDDQKVFKTIDDKKLEGLFQISGDAFRGKDLPRKDKETGETLRDKDGNVKTFHIPGVIEITGCHDFQDIVAANALGRPGPLALDMPKKYAQGKHHPDSIEYPHESLREILEPTYGQLVFQEQLISMAQKLAGFTFAEADKLRKACAKKKSELLEGIKPKFFEGCKGKGIPESVVFQMWDIAVEFGSYAFNKSHSTAYGAITYQTAFLKTYYPAEFISSLLTTAASSSDDRLEAVTHKLKEEYRNMEILKPNINKSKKSYYPIGNSKKKIKIIPPLFSIKGVGKKVSDGIIDIREKSGEFIDMKSFLKLSTSSKDLKISNAVGDVLIENGVFEDFGTRSDLREEMVRFNSIKKTATRGGRKNWTDSAVEMTSLY